MSAERTSSIPGKARPSCALLRILLLLSISGPLWAATPVRVAVAANFKPTLEQINRQFESATGYAVSLSSGSTGVLYSQILHGAPYDLFFAADAGSATKLKASPRGASLEAPFCYARGRLVLAGGNGQFSQLANPDFSVAIANPATAPYGAAAMQVLAREEFSAGASRKLVRGANSLQAYQFWYSGSVALGLLPRALVPAGALIPQAWHPPLEQYALVLTPTASNPALAAYLNWIRSDTVRASITAAGYESCL